MTDNLEAKRLRRNCTWQRAKGTSRDNGYPYHKHVPDCDICQGADKIDKLQAQIKELEDLLDALWKMNDAGEMRNLIRAYSKPRPPNSGV